MSIRMMADVWDLDLHREQKLVLLAFADHADDEGRCFPSLERIAYKCGYSRASAKRKTHALIEAGLLVVLREGNGRGKPSVYQVRPEKGVRLAPFGEKGGRRIEERGSSENEKGVVAATPESVLTVQPEPVLFSQDELEKQPADRFRELWELHPRGSEEKAHKQYRKATHRNGKPPKIDHDTLLACLTSYVDTEVNPKWPGHDLERWIRDGRWSQELAKGVKAKANNGNGALASASGHRVSPDSAARFL